MATECNPEILKIAKRYLVVLRKHGVVYESAWLFGSITNNHGDSDSDIDIAVSLRDVENKFYKELELTKYRRGVDTRIEPHVFREGELDTPFFQEVIQTGIRID